MVTYAHRTTEGTDDTGIEIQPGIVCVDLTVADLDNMTVDALANAMAEAGAQKAEANPDHEDLLGDFDTNPL